MKKVTMADVAKEAGVSKSTVSQYLNERFEYMGEDTKNRIKEAVEKLNYRPNIIARSLRQKKTSTIGVIVANILHSFSTQVIRSIEDVCSESNINVIVCNADDNPKKERMYIEMLRNKQVDGLIIFPTGGNYDLYKSMEQENFPIVFMDRYVKGINALFLMLDNEYASEMAVGHLFEKGYTNIGMLTTSIQDNISVRVERLEGYKKALKKRDLPIIDQYYKSVDPPFMKEALAEMFEEGDPPEALFCSNDLALIEALKFAKENQFCLPSDLGIISIDEVVFSEIYSPQLTVVSQPASDMGKEAAEKLLEMIQMELKNVLNIIRYLPTLKVREST
ncbi:LacI family DNA-binding transcriptional regulator [Lysinibacillus sphaericus]